MSPHRVCSTKKFFLLIFVGHRVRGKAIPLLFWFPDMPTITCTHKTSVDLYSKWLNDKMLDAKSATVPEFESRIKFINWISLRNEKTISFQPCTCWCWCDMLRTNKWFLRKYYYLAGRFGAGRLFRIRQSVTTTSSFYRNGSAESLEAVNRRHSLFFLLFSICGCFVDFISWTNKTTATLYSACLIRSYTYVFTISQQTVNEE